MNTPLDSDLARLFRWVVLPIAVLAAVIGFDLMPLVPGPREATLGEYAFRLTPILVATGLTLLAAWLRKQEALDPAYQGAISKSLFGHFAIYSGFTLLICLVVAVLLNR